MNYSDIKPNDSINGEGVCVSLFVSGCTNYCKGCFNKETWDFTYGKEFTDKEMNYILECINKNGITRNFSVLGGDPLHENNINTVLKILSNVKNKYPEIKTYVWSGYLYEDIINKYDNKVFENIDILIDGKFEEDKKDLTLKLRGSRNQRVIKLG